ncbi:MAG: hypothetical protein SGPRY_003353 [Prymnesium sp.]
MATAQLGEQALHDLLLKQQAQWSHIISRDDVDGYITRLPHPSPDATADTTSCNGGNGSSKGSSGAGGIGIGIGMGGGQRLDYCIKAETVISVEPESVARAYFDVGARQSWHSHCTDSRMVEELWPATMCVASFTYRTDLPVYPRGYCALVHRANHQIVAGGSGGEGEGGGGGETQQIIIVDRSISHPSVPPSRDMIFMDVFPSGLIITPRVQGGELHSHVCMIAHFDLKGTISSQLLERMAASMMLESLCFKYLAEFKKHLSGGGGADTGGGGGAKAPPKRSSQREAELASEGAATLIYAANSVGS